MDDSDRDEEEFHISEENSIFAKAFQPVMKQQALQFLLELTLSSLPSAPTSSFSHMEAIFGQKYTLEKRGQVLLQACPGLLCTVFPRKLDELIHGIVSSSCRNVGQEVNRSQPAAAEGIEIEGLLDAAFKRCMNKGAASGRRVKKVVTVCDEDQDLKIAQNACTNGGCTCAAHHEVQLSYTQLYGIAKEAVQIGRDKAANDFANDLFGIDIGDIWKVGMVTATSSEEVLNRAKANARNVLGNITAKFCTHQKEWCEGAAECIMNHELDHTNRQYVLEVLEEHLLKVVRKSQEHGGGNIVVAVADRMYVVGEDSTFYLQGCLGGFEGGSDTVPPWPLIVKLGRGSLTRGSGDGAGTFWASVMFRIEAFPSVVNLAALPRESRLAPTAAVINQAVIAQAAKREELVLHLLAAFGYTQRKKSERLSGGCFDTGTTQGFNTIPDLVMAQRLVHLMAEDALADVEELVTEIFKAKLERKEAAQKEAAQVSIVLGSQQNVQGIARWTAQELEKMNGRILGKLFKQSLSRWAHVKGGHVKDVHDVALGMNELLFRDKDNADDQGYRYRDVCSLANLKKAQNDLKRVLGACSEGGGGGGGGGEGEGGGRRLLKRLEEKRQDALKVFVQEVLKESPEVKSLLMLGLNPDKNTSDDDREEELGVNIQGTAERLLEISLTSLGYNTTTGKFSEMDTYTEDNIVAAAASGLVSLLQANVNFNMVGIAMKERLDSADGHQDPFKSAGFVEANMPDIVESADKATGALAAAVGRMFQLPGSRNENEGNVVRLAELRDAWLKARPDILCLLRGIDTATRKLGMVPSGGFASFLMKARQSQDVEAMIGEKKHIAVPGLPSEGCPGDNPLHWSPRVPDIPGMDATSYDNQEGEYHIVAEEKNIECGKKTFAFPELHIKLQAFNKKFQLGLFNSKNSDKARTIKKGEYICLYGGMLVGHSTAQSLKSLGQAEHIKTIEELRKLWYMDGRCPTTEEYKEMIRLHRMGSMINGPHPRNQSLVNAKFCSAPRGTVVKYNVRFPEKEKIKDGDEVMWLRNREVVMVKATRDILPGKSYPMIPHTLLGVYLIGVYSLKPKLRNRPRRLLNFGVYSHSFSLSTHRTRNLGRPWSSAGGHDSDDESRRTA